MKQFSVATMAFTLSLLLGSALAADEYLLSEKTYNALNSAQKLMEKQQYQQAEQQLLELFSATKKESYDAAMVQQTLGYLYSSQDNYAKAAAAFETALNAETLPDDVSHNLRYNLGQILIADKQFTAGIKQLEIWLKQEPKPDNDAMVLLATAHYQTENFSQSAQFIDKAINNSQQAPENWYQLLLSSYLSLNQYSSAIAVVETLIVRFPDKKEYWQQLAGLYMQENEEFRAVAVRLFSEKLALGDVETLINLVDMYRYLGIPYKAAQLLQSAMAEGRLPSNLENQQRLTESLIAAHEDEQAAKVLQIMLAEDVNGQAHLTLGRIYISQQRWQQAVDILSAGLSQLQGNDSGQAHTWLGIAYLNLEQLEEARHQFTQALSYPQQSSQANRWLQHIDQLQQQTDASSAQ